MKVNRYIFIENFGRIGILDTNSGYDFMEHSISENTPGLVVFKDVSQDEDYIGYDESIIEMELLCEKMNEKENLKLLLKENLSIYVETNNSYHDGVLECVNVKVKLFFDEELISEFSS